MKIVTIGRGNVGGGLARLWRDAGHGVTELGREGGDASDADVVVLAVPSGKIATALASVDGVDGKIVIDTTNAFDSRNEKFASLAHEVKAITGGPVAKAFNTNYADIYDALGAQRARPSNLYAADDDAVEAVEQLTRDAGYEPVRVGDLGSARTLEDLLANLLMPIKRVRGRSFFYRFAEPGEL